MILYRRCASLSSPKCPFPSLLLVFAVLFSNFLVTKSRRIGTFDQLSAQTIETKDIIPYDLSTKVGLFTFPLSDDRLVDGQNNLTLTYRLNAIWQAVYEYWTEYDSRHPPLEEDALNNITSVASSELRPKELDKYHDVLLTMANNSLVEYQRNNPDNPYPGFFDLTKFYLDAVDWLHNDTTYWSLSSLMGVGRSVDCSSRVNDILSVKSEWEKAGSQAATTLMALVPTILAFGNLFVPRNSEVYATSAIVGLTTSVYSLGLPVRSLPVIRSERSIDLWAFSLVALAAICGFAAIPHSSTSTDEQKTLKQLRSWSDPDLDTNIRDDIPASSFASPDPNAYSSLPSPLAEPASFVAKLQDLNSHWDLREIKSKFAFIRRRVENWHERWHWWNIPALLIAGGQAVMFALAIAPLFIEPGVSVFMLDCNGNWTGFYLGVSALVNAVIRFFMWEISSHERVRIYSLSSSSLTSLRHLIETSSQPRPSTATEFPPLYRPVPSTIRNAIVTLRNAVVASFFRLVSFRKFRKFREFCASAHRAIFGQGLSHAKPFQVLRSGITRSAAVVKYCLSNPLKILWAGVSFRRLANLFNSKAVKSHAARSHAAARRYRPLILLIHLSTASRSVLITLITGFVEALLLLVLTFFFAAQWGGNLIITAFAMLLLLIFTTAGRAVGLIYVYWSSHVWDLSVINCESKDEVKGVLRIVCSMEGVLVSVNGAWYLDGYRLNDMEGFADWSIRYELGELDEDEDCHEKSGEGSELPGRKGSDVAETGSNGRELYAHERSDHVKILTVEETEQQPESGEDEEFNISTPNVTSEAESQRTGPNAV